MAGNATADQIQVREGLPEDPTVSFRGFPFLTQAVRGRFDKVDVTVHDLERGGVRIERIDATLEGVEVDFRDALRGRVQAVPVNRGEATVRLSYGDLTAYLANKPGDIRIVLSDGVVVVRSTFGLPTGGEVQVEGRPAVQVSKTAVRFAVSNVRVVGSTQSLSATLAARAALRSSFTVPFDELPFGIEATSAELTTRALVVTASATGFVIDVRDNLP
jgi:methyl coenzyme M reductase subunit D